jgi:hypothetical protein
MVFDDDCEPPCWSEPGVEHFRAGPVASFAPLRRFNCSQHRHLMAVKLLMLTNVFPSIVLQNNRSAQSILSRSYELALFETRHAITVFPSGRRVKISSG